MTLDTLIQDIDPSLVKNRPVPAVTALCTDSRKVVDGAIFFALPGVIGNGEKYIEEAIERGAKTIVTSQAYPRIEKDVCHLRVDDPKCFLRDVAKKYYQNPSEEVRCIGITGTNGKTTGAYLVESILHENHQSCGVIGTVNYRLGSKMIPSGNTTPGFLDNLEILKECVQEGIPYCVWEVSSHALDQGRVDGITFRTAAFTNLTSDHLDYHKTRENYFQVKSLLFRNLPAESYAVINIDDAYGRKLVGMTDARVLTTGIKSKADIMAQDIQLTISGTEFKLVYPGGAMTVRTKLVGEFNVYNVLTAAGIGIAEQIDHETIRRGIEHLEAVPGRLERVECGQDFTVFIDYAHTADALENVLATIRKTSDAKIIVVFGCGGDRDKSKRPEMGRVVTEMADVCFITSDNPRSEEPLDIVHDILDGIQRNNYHVVVERKEAIEQALRHAATGDIVLIAGKGHEDYQVFRDGTIKFNEKQIIRQTLLC